MPTAASGSGMIFAPITEVHSGADRKNNDMYDKPELVRAVSFDLLLPFFPCRPLELFANLGSLTKFLRRFGHHDWNRIRRRNRPHAPRHFPSSKPLNLRCGTNLKCAIKHKYCGIARRTGGARDWNSCARISSRRAQCFSLARGSIRSRCEGQTIDRAT